MNNNQKEKIEKIFKFLEENREYNKEFQKKDYKKVLNWKNTVFEKLESLFYNVINTQSWTDFDNRWEFFKYFHKHFSESWEKIKFWVFLDFLYKAEKNDNDCILKDADEKFLKEEGFKKFMQENQNTNTYKKLFYLLERKKWWWPKTSALFVKTIYHIHNENYLWKEFHIFSDFPEWNFENDEFFLPVDEVIIQIFKKILWVTKTFKSMNNFLKDNFSKYSLGTKMEIWDDLWFWGYFTQSAKVQDSQQEERVFGWNENKYYVSEFSDKEKIGKIFKKANEFIRIINN